MIRPVYFLPKAEAELLDGQAWYDDRAFGLGDRFFAAVDSTVSRIGVAPQQFSLVHENIRRALVRRFLCALYFRTEPDGVYVIACTHTSRAAKHWKRRV